jgi:hypothetical protein
LPHGIETVDDDANDRVNASVLSETPEGSAPSDTTSSDKGVTIHLLSRAETFTESPAAKV